MPRQIRQPSTESVWYLPNVDANRTDPDPFKVLIRPLSGREKRRIEREAVSVALNGNGDGFEKVARSSVDRAILASVEEVCGYQAMDAQKRVTEPHTAEELLEAILSGPASELEVLDDIFFAITRASALEAGLEKNFDGRSSTSSPATTAAGAQGDGTAETAEPAQQETSETSAAAP